MWTILNRRLLRPQWSLRSFLLACLILAALTGWFARKCSIARRAPVYILGPVTANAAPPIEPPSDDRIVRRLRDTGALEDDFNVLRIASCPIARHADSARTVPLIGTCSLHHQLYLCIVVGSDGWLPRVEVAIVDHNHFRLANGE